jgi:hypothetical protein
MQIHDKHVFKGIKKNWHGYDFRIFIYLQNI